MLDKFYDWLNENITKAAPQSKLAGAISYALKQWPNLTTYIDDGRLKIDNNTSERAIKPFVIGRKNWLFSDKPEGARASCIIYSLIETCKAHEINPYNYFRHVLDEIVHTNTAAELERLLSYNLDQNILKNL